MPWKYSNVNPKANPDCPWCHKNEAVSPAGPEHRYACQQCATTFSAQWEPDAHHSAVPPLFPKGHPDASPDGWR